MTLYDLRNILSDEFDFSDHTVCGSFYADIKDIRTSHAKKIVVESISSELVCCRFTEFLESNRSAVKRYLEANYEDGDELDYLRATLCDAEDINEDGGEAVYRFIENDIADFLVCNAEE